MIKTSYIQRQKDLDFIESYSKAVNSAAGSKVDANSNVSNKNIATMAAEIHKEDNMYANRLAMYKKIDEMYGRDLAEEYIRQLEEHEIYRHDETGMPIGTPYCVAITMYPFLTDGLKKLGGTSTPPKNLDSFSGSFINLVFAIAAQFAGAVATPEFLPYFTYFCVKEFGKNFHLESDKIIDNTSHQRTIRQTIESKFQQIVYSLNQPAAARGSQSVFWNIAYFDEPYFKSLFENFVFPDGTEMFEIWEETKWIQKTFMEWFNKERTKDILTFPVESFSLLHDNENFIDEDSFDWCAEMYSKGHSFFTYISDSVDSLSSCCRLRNELQDNTFSYTLGAGGVATGSKCVMTININRLVQNAYRMNLNISDEVYKQVKKVHKYLTAFNEIEKEMLKYHMLQVYDAGFISLEKQYLTTGVNGVVEGAEFLGIEINDNEDYQSYINSILEPIYRADKEDKTDELMWNCEFVPAENLGVKNAKWDRRDGYFVPRDCYNSYFYRVEDETLTPMDKFILHGKKYTQYCDGGSAYHCNLKEHLSKEQYKFLMKYAIKQGTPYFTFNIPNTICDDCGFISKQYLDACPHCGSKNVDYATRVIGYLTRVSKWSLERQAEFKRRANG